MRNRINRRRALVGIAMLTGSGLAALRGATYLGWNQTPDLAYLRQHQSLLAALTETILPATDTPGAIEAGVPEFVLTMLLENSTAPAQNRFITGMKAIDAYCTEQYGQVYTHCSRVQQDKAMRFFESKGTLREGLLGKIQRKLLSESFFSLLKHYTCIGYCTSRIGATRGLAYAAIPGRYAGNISLRPGQKAWATK